MKKINWHNPANATPPEGYRLLIPEEVQFSSGAKPGSLRLQTKLGGWSSPMPDISGEFKTSSYAVPQDTPLPEGYAVIDGEPWQMDGWTLNVPGVTPYSRENADVVMEVMYRNGIITTNKQRLHWFSYVPNNRSAEIIGWRVVEQEKAPEAKPMTATEIMEQRYPKDRAADRAWEASHLMMQQLEDFRTVLAENQRLKNELADAQATLNSIRSLLP